MRDWVPGINHWHGGEIKAGENALCCSPKPATMSSRQQLGNTMNSGKGITVLESSGAPAALAIAEALDADAQTSFDNTPKASVAPEGDEKPLWYLAYGSNLNSSVFKGRRGIRPLDARPVLAPGLQLAFDLPGVPYVEPRFANCRVLPARDGRQAGGGTALDRKARRELRERGADGGADETSFIPEDSEKELKVLAKRMQRRPWTGKERAMLGVAYLITPQDFARVLATEGGGSSYQMVAVDAHALKPAPEESATKSGAARRMSETEDLLTGERIRAFTLVAPPEKTRDVPGESSLRYLNLIREGAKGQSQPLAFPLE